MRRIERRWHYTCLLQYPRAALTLCRLGASHTAHIANNLSIDVLYTHNDQVLDHLVQQVVFPIANGKI
jgi:hypothetical protein